MRRNAVPILLLSLMMLGFPAAGNAAEKSFGLFGFKKSVKKTPSDATALSRNADAELTEEEKKMIRDMAEKAPAKYPAVPRRAPQQPVPPPKNPNDFLVRIPQPPVRITQDANGVPQAEPATKKA